MSDGSRVGTVLRDTTAPGRGSRALGGSAGGARKGRGYLLVGVLTIITLYLTIGYLLVETVRVVLRGQRVVAEVSSEYAVINDLFDALREDTRGATSVTWERAADASWTDVTLAGPGGETTYRFSGERVWRWRSAWERLARGEGTGASHWRVGHATVSAEVRDAMLGVVVTWRGKSRIIPERRWRLAAQYWVGRGYAR